MNDVKIRVNRLGAVSDAEVSLRPFMLFMGESGLGKSYVAFLAHYIYVLLNSNRLDHFFDDTDFKSLLKNAISGEIIMRISTAELFRWINADAVSYVRYMVGHEKLDGDVDIQWPFQEREITFTYTEHLEGLADNEDIVYSISTESDRYSLSSLYGIGMPVFSQLLQAILRRSVFADTSSRLNTMRRFAYVLPPSRGALLELNDRPSFRSGMYEGFFDLKNALLEPLIKAKGEDPVLEKLLNNVNNGSVAQAEGQFVYTTAEGIPMPLTAAASSVKELAPFTMILKKFHLDQSSILFEEPEAHLHPQRQQSVADLIAYALSRGIHMQVTTHSDYFIKRLNVLLRLCRLFKTLPENKIIALMNRMGVPAKVVIDPEMLNAYYLYRRADGSTGIKRYDLNTEEMIPFDSFEKTIMDDFNLSDMMDEMEFPEHSEE